VSIVIPCYNAGETLKHCLRSCFEQGHPDLEIILVDNNCSDGSPQLASQLARDAGKMISIVSCAQQGVAFALNEGYRHVTGDFVQWLDADDELGSDKIAQQVAALEKHSEADLAYGNWQWKFHPDAGRGEALFQFPERQRDDMLLELLANRWRPPHVHLLRRRLTDRLAGNGAWNTTTTWGNDREYFTLAALIGSRFLYVPISTVCYHAWSGEQMTTRIKAPQRLDALSHIFHNLTTIAAASEFRLSPRHELLLNRNWLAMQGARPATGADEQDVMLANLLNASGTQGATADLATTIVRSLLLRLTGPPPRPPETIARALGQLRATFGPNQPIRRSDLSDNAALLDGEPPAVAPVLIPERLAVEERLHRMVDRGVLRSVPG
jgi:glycosyltransferase involved in cell wall biosynthesis